MPWKRYLVPACGRFARHGAATKPAGFQGTPATLFPGHSDDAIDAVQPGDVVLLDGHGAVDGGTIVSPSALPGTVRAATRNAR